MSNKANKEAFYLYIIQIANMVIPLVSFSYLAKILGLVGFGQVSFYQTISFLTIFFVDFGFNMSAAQKLSLSFENKLKVDELYSNVQVIKILIFLILFIVSSVGVVLFPLSNMDATLIFIGVISSFSAILLSSWVFQGIGKNSVLALFSVVGRAISVVLIFLFIHKKSDVIVAICIQVLISFLIGISSIFYFYKKNIASFSFKLVSVENMKVLMVDSYHNFSASLFTLGFTYLNPIVVKIFFGDAFLGLYAMADKLAMVIKQLFTPVIQAYYSRMCILSHEENYSELIKNAKKIAFFFMCISIVVFLGNFLIGEYVYTFLFGKEYKITNLLSIMIVTQFVISMAMVLVNLLIIPLGQSKILKNYYFFGLVFHFCYFYFFVKYLHVYGIASAILLTEMILTFSFYLYVRKYFSKAFPVI